MGEMTDCYLEGEDPDTPLYSFGGLKSCQHCGRPGLRWIESERTRKYRLAESKGNKLVIHTCKEYKHGQQ